MITIESGPESSPDLNNLIGEFVSRLIWGQPDQIEKFCSLGVFSESQLVAGVLYHNWHPAAGVIEMSAASLTKKWLTRAVLKAMFALPFEKLGCQLCVLRVSEQNKPMVRIAKAYGFQDHLIPRLRGRNEAEHILTLADDTWRANGFHKEHANGQA